MMNNRKKNVLKLGLIFCIFFIDSILYFNTHEILQTYRNNENNEYLKISENHNPIFIDGNNMFTVKASSEGWDGDGTLSNPYIIENYIISTSFDEHGIEIRNTDLYFIIKNVNISNGASNYKHGFYLNNVTNGKLINNTANNNIAGFLLKDSNNNTVRDNIVNNNLHGFRIWYSTNNSLINNTANDNIEYGVFLDNSNNNTISENILLRNGIDCIYEKNCIWNNISDNICGPQPFTLFSDVDGFDEDGSFKLTWTVSEYADNYALYQNKEIIAEGLKTTNYPIHNLAIETYEFFVKAINKYEELDSNTIEVIVSYTIHVDGNADFHQKAVTYNFFGDGTYNNPYIIENYEIVASVGHGIHIQNTDIYFIIRNVRVSNGLLNNYFGFYFESVTHGKLENNTAKNNIYGFLLKDSYNNSLEGNTAIDNINGIIINSSNFNTLTFNNIMNNRHGLSLDSSYNNALMSNEIKDNTYLGIYLGSSNNNIIINNTATGNLNGFSLSYSNNNILTNNTANNNDQHGFHLWYSNNNTLTYNIANQNFKYGIYLEESKFNKISGNSLEDNGLGPIYEKMSEEMDFPDLFLISAIIFIIAVVSYIIIKATFFIKKKLNRLA